MFSEVPLGDLIVDLEIEMPRPCEGTYNLVGSFSVLAVRGT